MEGRFRQERDRGTSAAVTAVDEAAGGHQFRQRRSALSRSPLTELFRALGALAEAPSPELAPVAKALGLGALPPAAEHTELFSFHLYPYASVYLGTEGMLGGEARDRVAGFWRALDLTPPEEPDHLAVLLAFYASLATEHRAAGGDDGPQSRARRAFLWEHLLSWLPVYLEKLAEVAPPFYRRWAALLEEALIAEAAIPGPPEAAPLALRQAPALADPREAGAGPFLEGLLAPVACGMVLIRPDLARAAEELGLGLRAGERRYALEHLLAQEPGPVLAWLAREAAGWAERHRRQAAGLGPVSRAWEDQARRAAALLDELSKGCNSDPSNPY